jgi:hypothetical protein
MILAVMPRREQQPYFPLQQQGEKIRGRLGGNAIDSVYDNAMAQPATDEVFVTTAASTREKAPSFKHTSRHSEPEMGNGAKFSDQHLSSASVLDEGSILRVAAYVLGCRNELAYRQAANQKDSTTAHCDREHRVATCNPRAREVRRPIVTAPQKPQRLARYHRASVQPALLLRPEHRERAQIRYSVTSRCGFTSMVAVSVAKPCSVSLWCFTIFDASNDSLSHVVCPSATSDTS